MSNISSGLTGASISVATSIKSNGKQTQEAATIQEAAVASNTSTIDQSALLQTQANQQAINNQAAIINSNTYTFNGVTATVTTTPVNNANNPLIAVDATVTKSANYKTGINSTLGKFAPELEKLDIASLKAGDTISANDLAALLKQNSTSKNSGTASLSIADFGNNLNLSIQNSSNNGESQSLFLNIDYHYDPVTKQEVGIVTGSSKKNTTHKGGSDDNHLVTDSVDMTKNNADNITGSAVTYGVSKSNKTLYKETFSVSEDSTGALNQTKALYRGNLYKLKTSGTKRNSSNITTEASGNSTSAKLDRDTMSSSYKTALDKTFSNYFEAGKAPSISGLSVGDTFDVTSIMDLPNSPGFVLNRTKNSDNSVDINFEIETTKPDGTKGFAEYTIASTFNPLTGTYSQGQIRSVSKSEDVNIAGSPTPFRQYVSLGYDYKGKITGSSVSVVNKTPKGVALVTRSNIFNQDNDAENTAKIQLDTQQIKGFAFELMSEAI